MKRGTFNLWILSAALFFCNSLHANISASEVLNRLSWATFEKLQANLKKKTDLEAQAKKKSYFTPTESSTDKIAEAQSYLNELAEYYQAMNYADITTIGFLQSNCEDKKSLLKPELDTNLCKTYPLVLYKLIEGRIGTVTSQYLYTEHNLKAPPDWPEHSHEIFNALKRYNALGLDKGLDNGKGKIYELEGDLIGMMRDKLEGKRESNDYKKIPQYSPLPRIAQAQNPAGNSNNSNEDYKTYLNEDRAAVAENQVGKTLPGRQSTLPSGYNQSTVPPNYNQPGYNQINSQPNFNQTKTNPQPNFNQTNSQPGYNQQSVSQTEYNQINTQPNFNQIDSKPSFNQINSQPGCNQPQSSPGYVQFISQSGPQFTPQPEYTQSISQAGYGQTGSQIQPACNQPISPQPECKQTTGYIQIVPGNIQNGSNMYTQVSNNQGSTGSLCNNTTNQLVPMRNNYPQQQQESKIIRDRTPQVIIMPMITLPPVSSNNSDDKNCTNNNLGNSLNNVLIPTNTADCNFNSNSVNLSNVTSSENNYKSKSSENVFNETESPVPSVESRPIQPTVPLESEPTTPTVTPKAHTIDNFKFPEFESKPEPSESQFGNTLFAKTLERTLASADSTPDVNSPKYTNPAYWLFKDI